MRTMKADHPLGVCTVAVECPSCHLEGQMPKGTPCPTCTKREKDNSGYGCISACNPMAGPLPENEWCTLCPNR